MNLKEDCRFMYLGKNKSVLTFGIPFPTSAPFETTRNVTSGRTANGVVVGQQIGRSLDKQSMTWNIMTPTLWWSINNFIEQNGMFFYCKYFSHNFGVWKTRRFYCSDFKCEPANVNSVTGIPELYRNCSFNVIDCGE